MTHSATPGKSVLRKSVYNYEENYNFFFLSIFSKKQRYGWLYRGAVYSF